MQLWQIVEFRSGSCTESFDEQLIPIFNHIKKIPTFTETNFNPMVLLSFDSWWEGLNAFTKIYWLITIPASFIFLIQMGFILLNPDTKTKATNSSDSNILSESTIAFQPINFRNLIGFFTILGWSGLACIDSGLSPEATILTSFVCGLAMLFTMATIFYIIGKLMNDVRENLD